MISFVEGDCSAIDFETKMYADSMGVLEHHIKPVRSVPGVVLEQAYLNKMSEGLRPFCQLASNKCKFYFFQKTKFSGTFHCNLMLEVSEECPVPKENTSLAPP